MGSMFKVHTLGLAAIRNTCYTSLRHGRVLISCSTPCTPSTPKNDAMDDQVVSPKNNLCLRGRINGVDARMLVVTGSTKNIISSHLAASIARLSDATSQVCNGLTLELGENYRTVIDAVVEDLDRDKDVVLGVEWLSTIGKCAMNFQLKRPQLEFFHQGHKISVTGV